MGVGYVFNNWIVFLCLWFKFMKSGKSILMLLLLLEFIMVLTFAASGLGVIYNEISLVLLSYFSVLMVGESLVGMSMLIKFSRSYSKENYII